MSWAARKKAMNKFFINETGQGPMDLMARLIFFPGAVWFFIKRYQDPSRDQTVSLIHPWQEVAQTKTKHGYGWNGMGICNCDGHRIFNDVECMASKISSRIKDNNLKRVTLWDVGSGQCLAVYIYIKRILEANPGMDLTVVMSDSHYYETRGEHIVALSGISFEPLEEGQKTNDKAFDASVYEMLKLLAAEQLTCRVVCFGNLNKANESQWNEWFNRYDLIHPERTTFFTHCHFEIRWRIRKLRKYLEKECESRFIFEEIPDPVRRAYYLLSHPIRRVFGLQTH